MKIFEIWSEGYHDVGNWSPATCHGKILADSLKEACDLKAKYDDEFQFYYNPEKMTYWGCQLFDNEADARKSFG